MITGGYEGQMAFSEDNYHHHHPQQGPQRQQEPQLDSISSPTATSSSSRSQMKCNHKGCTVGRNHAKRSSWFRQKIHFVDVSKLRHPKLCMKTTLVGDDCKPLLIQAGEDVNVPLANRVTNGEPEKKHNNRNSPNNKGHCGKCGLLLDALARTFCLPLLGWSLMVDRWEEDQLWCQWSLQFMAIPFLLIFFWNLFDFQVFEFLTFFPWWISVDHHSKIKP